MKRLKTITLLALTVILLTFCNSINVSASNLDSQTLLLLRPSTADYGIDYYLKEQPKNVRNFLAKQNVDIQVVDELEWQSPDALATFAYTMVDFTDDRKTITGIKVRLKRGYTEALPHEIGHVISCYNNIAFYWANTPEFEQIWQLESHNSMLIANGWADSDEYFAEAYKFYVESPEWLKEHHPMTYEYVKAVVAQAN